MNKEGRTRLPGAAAVTWAMAVILAGVFGCAHAQTVYRCETNGSVSYSHAPCLGATVVDTTPTEGLDTSSGVRRVGRDVQRERIKKSINEAWQPWTGMTHEEAKDHQRRLKLPASVKLECQWLDHRLPAQEAAAKNADAQGREKAEAELFLGRSRYRNLGC